MKWQSPIVGDLRNQLAKSIVGSTWKGRHYFRNYVIPANPRTLPQQAFREVHRLAVETWQFDYTTPQEVYDAWTLLGKRDRLPGFNKFIQLCRRNQIYIEVLELTAEFADIRVHYFNALNHYDTGLIQSSQGVNWDTLIDPGLLDYKTWSYTDVHLDVDGIYAWYLNSRIVRDALAADPLEKSRHAHWAPDETTGQAKVASIAVAFSPGGCDPGWSGNPQPFDWGGSTLDLEWDTGILTRIGPQSYPTGFTGDVEVQHEVGIPATNHTWNFEDGLLLGMDGDADPSRNEVVDDDVVGQRDFHWNLGCLEIADPF